MRRDAIGMFWRDEPVVKVVKEKVKVTPPDPVWLNDDYLPYLSEARAFNFPQFSDAELVEAMGCNLTLDCEVYSNYFLCAFKCPDTKRVTYIETVDGALTELDRSKLLWILENFQTISFNGLSYDLTMLALALAGKTTQEIKQASNELIEQEISPYQILKERRVKKLKLNHIDLKEVAPLHGGLKAYSGRLFCRRMQDLPFAPDKWLSDDQICVTRYYCVNDLDNTELLWLTLQEQIQLRIDVGRMYGLDLRSRSDAQIAEDVFSLEVEQMSGRRAFKPIVAPGTMYFYKIPSYLNFRTELLRWVLNEVRIAPFLVAFHGAVEEPKQFEKLWDLQIADSKYAMGIGGLHSKEKKIAHHTDSEYTLHDFDVTSFYPRIMINQGLFPHHLGPNFLRAFNAKVEERIVAKRIKDMVKANGFKILVNGSFGKLGSKYSNLYAPDLLVQVTMTGQLSLLYLIEKLELAGIHVVSANTDGIVVKCKRTMHSVMYSIVKEWERETCFELEETRYMSLYSRDVNNYIAVKQKFDKENKVWIEQPDKCKTKGAYANPWNDASDKSMWMHKNPVNVICIDAIEAMLTKGVPIVTTITKCRDITKFLTVRKVSGGAVKDGEYFGSHIRWYYSNEVEGPLIYGKSGKRVPRSMGARPMMTLTEEFPQDVDFDWYVKESEKILKQIGYV
ncbi:MAG TPA: hypothetical protein VN039_10540 [Nitrospira sp.]|nr:hypothetical protein [Nitrospira sp.]